MSGIDFMLIAYFVVQAVILWLLVTMLESKLIRFGAMAVTVLLIPSILVLQDGSVLADGGGVRNIIAFIWALGGCLIAAATLVVQRLRYKRNDG